MTVSTPIVMFLLTAVATGADTHFRVGERHAILAFVRAETREAAEADLPTILSNNGWRDWQVQQWSFAGAKNDEGILEAREKGASLTVYSDPIPSN